MTGISIAKSKEEVIKEQLGVEGYILYEKIKKIQNTKGIQTMMPYYLHIY